MRIVDNASFLDHVGKQGVGLDTRYSEPRELGYQNDLWFSVPMSGRVLQRKQMISATLTLFSDETPVWVWRRGGVWRLKTPEDRPGPRVDADRAAYRVFAMAGIHDEQEVTLYLDPHEKDVLYAILFMNSLAAGSVWQDLFVVPEDQGLVLSFDHHEDIAVRCRDQATYDLAAKGLAAAMKRSGLPADCLPLEAKGRFCSPAASPPCPRRLPDTRSP